MDQEFRGRSLASSELFSSPGKQLRTEWGLGTKQTSNVDFCAPILRFSASCGPTFPFQRSRQGNLTRRFKNQTPQYKDVQALQKLALQILVHKKVCTRVRMIFIFCGCRICLVDPALQSKLTQKFSYRSKRVG
jgi:hypothetical protein